MKYLILVNPLSHGGEGQKIWQKYAEQLSDYELVVLEDINQATTLSATTKLSTVVAVGGDGTINACVKGVLLNPNKELKFGVLYAGTSPDFCTFHNIPIDQQAVEVLLKDKVEAKTVLLANQAPFLCSCNLGMGAEVAQIANRIRPKFGDKLGTFFAILWSVIRSKKYDYWVDDELIKNCNHLLITKMPYIAGGIKLTIPELKEQEFALWYVQNLNLWGWLKCLKKIYRQEPCGEVKIYQNRVVISSSCDISIEYDGDPHGMLPVEILVAEQRLNLICGR